MRLSGLVAMVGLLLAATVLAACGGGSAPSSPAQETFEAAVDEAERTPVDEPVREYASRLCGPLGAFFNEASDLFARFDLLETPEEETPGLEALGAFLELFVELEGPLEDFLGELRQVEPPEELADYHEDVVRQIEYAIESLRAFEAGDLFSALAAPSPPPNTEDPPGFESAIIQECGEELRDVIDRFGPGFFGEGDGGIGLP